MTGTVADQVTQVTIGLAVVLVVGGCAIGGGPSRSPQGEGNEGPSATRARLEPSPVEGSGVRGNATFAKATTGTRVRLELRGLPEPGEPYLAHIHPGSCEGEQRAEAPGGEDANHHGNGHGHGEDADAIGYPLTPLESDARGQGSSTTVLEGIAPDDCRPGPTLRPRAKTTGLSLPYPATSQGPPHPPNGPSSGTSEARPVVGR